MKSWLKTAKLVTMLKKTNYKKHIWFSIIITIAVAITWSIYIYLIKPSSAKLIVDKQNSHLLSKTLVNEYENRPAGEILNSIKQQFSMSVYRLQLEEQKLNILNKFDDADLLERIVLERELTLQEDKINNHSQLYNEKIKLLFNAYQSLKTFRESLPIKEYNLAQVTLISGDTNKANHLFSKIESKYRNAKERHEINRAAEASYQRGKIAQDQIDYRKAYRYYRRAVQLNPNNIEYLVAAGNVSDNMALYNNAIDYYEGALFVQSKNKEQPSYDTRLLWINLGNTWSSKNNLNKAIEYFELALASDLKSFGPNHQNVAMDKNHLGSAWEGKKKFKKAINYYTQAMKIYKITLGETHPITLSVKENIKRVTSDIN